MTNVESGHRPAPASYRNSVPPSFRRPMALSPRRTRLFVIGLVAFAVALAVFAAITITSGWSDEEIQEHVRQQEIEHYGREL